MYVLMFKKYNYYYRLNEAKENIKYEIGKMALLLLIIKGSLRSP